MRDNASVFTWKLILDPPFGWTVCLYYACVYFWLHGIWYLWYPILVSRDPHDSLVAPWYRHNKWCHAMITVTAMWCHAMILGTTSFPWHWLCAVEDITTVDGVVCSLKFVISWLVYQDVWLTMVMVIVSNIIAEFSSKGHGDK